MMTERPGNKSETSDELETLFAEGERIADYLDRLVSATNAMNIRRESITDSQGMAIFALARAVKTHRATLHLCRKGYGEDAANLVRSLFELAVDMRYVEPDPTGERARRWVDYGWALKYEMNHITKLEPQFEDYRRSLAKDDPIEQELDEQAERVQKEWGFFDCTEKDNLETMHRLHHWAGKGMST